MEKCALMDIIKLVVLLQIVLRLHAKYAGT